jgi:hypothetical protein
LTHFVTLEVREAFTRFVVGFFRPITYVVIAPELEAEALNEIAGALGVARLRAVQCQLDLQAGAKRFAAMLPDGSVRQIGSL